MPSETLQGVSGSFKGILGQFTGKLQGGGGSEGFRGVTRRSRGFREVTVSGVYNGVSRPAVVFKELRGFHDRSRGF